MNLNEMGEIVYNWCVKKGWEPDSKRDFGTECMLLTTEVSEAFEAYRIRKFETYTDPNGKPDDVASEFADILIRLLHYARVHEIDLETEFKRKMAYNEKRPWRHGGKHA